MTYERLTEEDGNGGFDYDLWFSSFETANLDLNALGSPQEAASDIVTVDGTFYLDQLNLDIGNGDNLVNISGLGANALIETGAGSDKFNIHSMTNSTFDTDSFDVATITAPGVEPAILNDRAIINAGLGDDEFYLNYHPTTAWSDVPEQTFENGILGTLDIHGQAGSDHYDIALAGNDGDVGIAGGQSASINVDDESLGDAGLDRLFVRGTNDNDFFLFRPSVIAMMEVDADRIPVVGGSVERINYDGDINAGITVYGREGDDTFVFDDVNASLEVNGDQGNDVFQVGQMFLSDRDASANLPILDQFPTTQTTNGFLSNGVSQPTTLNGGAGEDLFTVFHNLAELSLNGDEDNDTFVLRSFVRVDPDDPNAPITNVNGGQGADFIAFTVNSPVNIAGGDGLDTLTVIGTELGDDFVVTDSGVFGAGRFVRFNGVEKVVIDAIAGNDTFFIESTSEKVDLEIVGWSRQRSVQRWREQWQRRGRSGRRLEWAQRSCRPRCRHIRRDRSQVFRCPFTGISVNIGDNEEAEVLIRPRETVRFSSMKIRQPTQMMGLLIPTKSSRNGRVALTPSS